MRFFVFLIVAFLALLLPLLHFVRFEYPQVLWMAAVIVPALAGFFYWSWRVKQKLVLQFVHSRLASSLMAGVSPAREKVRLALQVAAVAGILCAIARPQWGFAWEEAKQQGLDIIAAIDTSKSMLARDVLPNRLEKAKLAVMDLMRLAKSDRMGLVVFAGGAFLQAPLTLDDQAFQQAVDAVAVGVVPVGGTSLSSAIRTTLQAFEKGNDNHKVMVLFTDGDDHDTDQDTIAAAKEAADAGMRIFTMGVGTPQGELLQVADEQGNMTFIKDENGNAVKSNLNEKLLREIATDANGFYLPLQGATPMETLYSRGLAPLPKSEETTRLTRVYQERYHWFLGFAVLCLVAEALLPERARSRAARKRTAAPALAKVAAAIVLALVPWNSSASPSSAFRDYQSGHFTNAFDEYNRLAQQKTNDYRLHYDAGAAAYKSMKLDDAEKQFNAALNSPEIISNPQTQQSTYYNLGNTLYQMGEPQPDPDKKKELWQQAIENYDRAIRLNTNDFDASNNMAFVQRKLEQLKQQQQQQQQQDKKDKKDQKDQKQKQDQNDQNQQQKKDQQGKQQKDQNQQQQKQQKSDQQKKDEEKAKQEQAKKDQEKKKQQQQQAQAGQDEKKGDQDKQDEQAAAELHMSPQEARQLLDQLKDDAKVLLFSPTNQPINTQRGKFKDW
ncbi:MAG TPA: VWA domain-containing protein [Verrucomicrobiae bacterium]|jgi:Ca-activated chloride channel family protein